MVIPSAEGISMSQDKPEEGKPEKQSRQHPTQTDPSAAYMDFVSQWERNFDAFANQVMGTDGFSQAMNAAQAAQLQFQRQFADSMKNQLAALNIPTRDDILRLGEAMQRVERRLEKIEVQLSVDTPPQPAKRPKRTKQPPAEYTTEEGHE
jgi:hypothetical protein